MGCAQSTEAGGAPPVAPAAGPQAALPAMPPPKSAPATAPGPTPAELAAALAPRPDAATEPGAEAGVAPPAAAAPLPPPPPPSIPTIPASEAPVFELSTLKARQRKIVPPGDYVPLIVPGGPCEAAASAVQERSLHRDDTGRFAKHGPHRALDGDPSTYFAGGYDSAQSCWLSVDLKRRCSAALLRVRLAHAAGTDVDVQARVDGVFCTVRRFKAVDGMNEVGFFAVLSELRLLQAPGHGAPSDASSSCGMCVASVELLGWVEHPEDFIHAGAPAIFLSYQWAQQPLVIRLRRDLEHALGIRAWMDLSALGGGDDLLSRIAEGMQQASAVVHCISPLYYQSVNCGKEVYLCEAMRKPAVVVSVDAATDGGPDGAGGAGGTGADSALWMAGPLAALGAPVPISWGVDSQDGADVSQPSRAYFQNINRFLDRLVEVLAAQPGARRALGPLPAERPASAVVDLQALQEASKLPDIVLALPQPAPGGPPAEAVDYARGRPCQSSGNYVEEPWPNVWCRYRAAAVVDGRGGNVSRWSGAKDGHGRCWVSIDLGCIVFVEKVRIEFEGAYASQWALDVLPDRSAPGAEWTTVGIFYGGESWHEGALDEPAAARRVRVRLLQPRWSGAGFSAWTVKVHGKSADRPTPELFVIWADRRHNRAGMILDEIESRTLKKAYVSSDPKDAAAAEAAAAAVPPAEGEPGPEGPALTPELPGPATPDPVATYDKSAALSGSEVVLLMATAATLAGTGWRADVAAARAAGKRTVPLLIEPGASWPPPPTGDAELDGHLKKLLYIRLSEEASYAAGLGLVQRLWGERLLA